MDLGLRPLVSIDEVPKKNPIMDDQMSLEEFKFPSGAFPILDKDVDVVPLNINGSEFSEFLENIPVNSQERSFIHTSMLMN